MIGIVIMWGFNIDLSESTRGLSTGKLCNIRKFTCHVLLLPLGVRGGEGEGGEGGLQREETTAQIGMSAHSSQSQKIQVNAAKMLVKHAERQIKAPWTHH